MTNKNIKTKWYLCILLTIATICLAIFSFVFVNVTSNKQIKSAHSAGTASLYLEGTNNLPTNKTGNVTLTLKLNNPDRKKIFYVGCHINYDNTCLTFANGKTNLSNWAGAINYNTSKGYINIPVSASDSSTQVTDAVITVATINFTINKPLAQVYPFTIDTISVSGMDPTAYKVDTQGETFNFTFREPSNDASVKSVSVKNGSSEVGSYDASTKTYTATVPYTVSSVNVYVTANNANATISGTGNFNLTAGTQNTKTVTITAEDKTTKETITFNITREQGNSNANINTIVLKNSSNNEIPLTKNGTTYTATIKQSESSGLKLTATAQESTSTVTINNGTPTNNALTLKVGENNISVKVTAQDGTRQEYIVKIIVNSSNTNLSSVLLKKSSGEEIPLTNSDSTYTATIKQSESIGLTLSATAEDANSTVTIEGGSATNFALTLEIGDNEFSIQVTAQDGTVKNYIVKITVQTEVTSSGLKSLSILGDGVNYNVIKSDEIYFVQYPNTVQTLKVNAEAADQNAQLKIEAMTSNSSDVLGTYQSGESIQLNSQINKLNIVITSQNGDIETFVVMLLPYPAGSESGDTYIKVGGDLDITITYTDFLTSSDVVVKNMVVESDRVVFYVDVKSNFAVKAIYNNNGLSETIETLADGSIRHSYNINKLDIDKSSILIEIIDKTTSVSKIYVVNLSVKQSDSANNGLLSTTIIIIVAVVLVVLVICCVTVGLAIKKLNKANEINNKMSE